MAKICQMCGTSNVDEIQFCSACGSELPGAGDKTGKAPQKGGPAKTMILGGAAAAVTEETQPAKTKPGDSSNQNKTMFGMPAVNAAGAAGATQDATAPEKKPKVSHQTAHGIEVSPKDSLPPPKADKPPMAQVAAQKQAGGNNKTMLGMAAITDDNKPKEKSGKPPMAKISTTPKPAAKVAPAAAEAQHTVLGMPAVTGDDTSKEAAVPQAKAAPAQKTEATRSPKKEPQKKEPAKKPMSESRSSWSAGPDSPSSDPSEYDEWPDEDAPRRKKPLGLIIGLVAGVVVVVVLLVVFFLLFKGDSLALTPQVFRTADGDKLTIVFSFTQAPQGSVIKVGDQNVPINAGQARFDLPINSLKLGANNLVVDYIEPGKSPEKQNFQIALRHTITTDLNGMMAQKPFVVVNFKVAPNINLVVEGKQVQLTGGSYAHNIPLSTIAANGQQTSDNLIHKVSFQIQDANGPTEQGQHVINIPLTKLQVDRPADEAIVDSATVICAGVAEPGSMVTVDGKPVGVTAIGFNHTVDLTTLGERKIQVTARVPGKAPNSQTVSVTRIQSLAVAIEDWSKDLDKKLDYPALGRNPNAYVDKKIKLSGRVVNISTLKGVTAFLLYIAEGCPKGARCAVYVVFRGETDAGLQSWVDVYGLVRGIRAVDLPSGNKLDVPAVDAKFVVKSKPGKRKRGRN